MERKTNWLAIAAAVVASMLIGFLWYGLFFQEQWMAGNGITMEGEKMFKNGTEIPMSATPMILNVIGMIVYALIMNWLIGLTGTTTWLGGAKIGGAIGLMFAIGAGIGNLFANNPPSLSLVDGSYVLAVFTAIGTIVGGWQKR